MWVEWEKKSRSISSDIDSRKDGGGIIWNRISELSCDIETVWGYWGVIGKTILNMCYKKREMKEKLGNLGCECYGGCGRINK